MRPGRPHGALRPQQKYGADVKAQASCMAVRSLFKERINKQRTL